MAGIGMILAGFYETATDLWSDGVTRGIDFLADVLFFIVPGLVTMGVGAKVGRRPR